MNIPLRIKQPFLNTEDLKEDEIATITELPSIISEEESKFGKEQTQVIVKLKGDGKSYRWTLNSTSNDRLVTAFSSDAEAWIGKTVKIQKRSENVKGEQRTVLYAQPVKVKETNA